MIYRKPKKEDAANMLQYLKRIGGESDNLTFGSEGLPFTIKQEEEYLDKLKDKLYTETVTPKQFFEGYKPQHYFKTDNNKICENCGCNPKNGGSGNCNCILATPTIF